MFRIREALIDKLPAATPATRPKPFPGRYPTRVWFEFADGHTYLGKPSTLLCQQLGKMPFKDFLVLKMIEFDRAAKFFGFRDGSVIGCKEYLSFYHPGMPFEFGASGRVLWFGSPFRTLRVGAHAFYTTFGPGEDTALRKFISERLNPPLAKPRLSPTRPAPRVDDYPSYAAYTNARTVWKQENAEYLAQKRAAFKDSLGKFKF